MEKLITALEEQKRNPDRINVFLDGEFAFGVSRLVGAWLFVGQKIDEVKTKALINDDEKERALQSAFRFIGYRQRTEAEVVKKLEQLEFDSDIISTVMIELKEKRYVDDKEFASQWIELRGESKPRSKRFIQFELGKKGISGEIIEEALKKAPDDMAMAVKLGKKYLSRYLAINDEEFRKKMIGVLSRRAFPYSVVNNALNELLNIRNENMKFEE
jgi:regulatory protein